MKIKYPIEHGNIKDFDDMKLVWSYVAKELKANYKDVAELFGN
jgi:actin-related protein